MIFNFSSDSYLGSSCPHSSLVIHRNGKMTKVNMDNGTAQFISLLWYCRDCFYLFIYLFIFMSKYILEVSFISLVLKFVTMAKQYISLRSAAVSAVLYRITWTLTCGRFTVCMEVQDLHHKKIM